MTEPGDLPDGCEATLGPLRCTLPASPDDHDGGHEVWREDGELIARWADGATTNDAITRSRGKWVPIGVVPAGDDRCDNCRNAWPATTACTSIWPEPHQHPATYKGPSVDCRLMLCDRCARNLRANLNARVASR